MIVVATVVTIVVDNDGGPVNTSERYYQIDRYDSFRHNLVVAIESRRRFDGASGAVI